LHVDAEAIVKELKENFARKDTEHLDKISSLKGDLSNKKKEIINLKGYGRELVALLEEWGPKGIEIPSIKKYQNLDLSVEKGNEVCEELRIRNIRLEEEIKRMKNLSSSQMKESRALTQLSMLQKSAAGPSSPGEVLKLKQEKSELAKENVKLAVLLKDGNKMDLNIILKENENLKKEIEGLRNCSSISPATSDQKLKFYEKHLKLLEK
jgi:predicted nuclease with TOPRIM domain